MQPTSSPTASIHSASSLAGAAAQAQEIGVRRVSNTSSSLTAEACAPSSYTGSSHLGESYIYHLDDFTEFTGICFSGGGAKGIGYLGVLDALGEEGLNAIERVSGASVGANTALMVALGCTPEEITQEALESEAALKESVITSNLKDFISKQLRKYLPNHSQQALENFTFKDLHNLKLSRPDLHIKDLFVTASWVSKSHNINASLCLSNETSPNMPLHLGLMASMALPIAFDRVVLTKEEYLHFFDEAYLRSTIQSELPSKMKLMDGGIINNCPWKYLNEGSHPFTSKTSNQNLVLAFSQDEGNFERELTKSEKLKNFLANASKGKVRGLAPYKARQDVLKAAHQCPNNFIYYLNPGIETTDLKKAKKHFSSLVARSKAEFKIALLKLKEESAWHDTKL